MHATLEYINQNALTRYPFKDTADLTWTSGGLSGELPNSIFTDARVLCKGFTYPVCSLLTIDYTQGGTADLDTWIFHFSLFDAPASTSTEVMVCLGTDLVGRIQIDGQALSTYFRAVFSGSGTLTITNPGSAVFCQSVYTYSPPKVSSVTINNTTNAGTTETVAVNTDHVTFNEGSNLQLTAANGGLTMDVVAGAGRGLYNACALTAGVVYRINNIAANGFNNFGLTSDNCFSIQRTIEATAVFPDEVLTLQSSDGNNYTVTLHTSGGVTALYINQQAVVATATGTTIKLQADDANYYPTSLATDAGVTALVVGQTSVSGTGGCSGMTLRSSDGNFYLVTLAAGSEVALVVHQDPVPSGWTKIGLKVNNLCQPQCTADQVQAFAHYLNRVKDGMLDLTAYLTQTKNNYDALCLAYTQQMDKLSQVQPPYLLVNSNTASNRKKDYHTLCCGVYSPSPNALTTSMAVSFGAGSPYALMPGTSYITQNGVKQALADTLGFSSRVIKCNNILYYGLVLDNNTGLINNGDAKFDVNFDLAATGAHARYTLPLLAATPNYTVAYTTINRAGVRTVDLTLALLYDRSTSLNTSLVFTVPATLAWVSGQLTSNNTVVTPVTASGFRNVSINYGLAATCKVRFTTTSATTQYIKFALATPAGFANKTIPIYL